jgi:signal peptidase II
VRCRLRPGGLAIFAGVAGLVVGADQVTKAFVRSELAFGEERSGAGPFSLHHVRNSGVLGGHLDGIALPLGIATALMLAALVVFVVLRRPRLPEIVAFALILGGGLGNLVDRLRLGYVTDFIDRGNDRAFNLADVGITLGLLVLGASYLPRRRSSPQFEARPRGD